MYQLRILGALALLALTAPPACDDGTVGEEGSEGNPCHADGTCDGELACLSGYCVSLPPCNAGDTLPCTCEDGEEGSETCTGDGVWGDCECSTECGNSDAETGEACDGSDLDGHTCESEGFAGGALVCSTTCELDTSGCSDCGNGVVDPGETCDGSALDGHTCESEGFAGDVLACDASCALDTSGCESCGNDVVDAGESCDGTALGGASCATLGYTVGTLSCNASCAFDTTGCMQCTETSAGVLMAPLMMVVLMDRSGSMSGTIWTSTVSALTQFYTDPASADILVGMNFFPPAMGDECDPLSYTPPQVPIVPLATDAQTLVNAMNATSPTGITPTYAALHGSLAYTTMYKDNNPTHETVVVLATDGDPTGCDTSIPNIAALAGSAYNYNGVKTYAVAIQGSTVSNLDQITSAGGGQTFDVTADITLFKQKMDEIRDNARSCELLLPAATLSNLANTNLLLTPLAGTPERLGLADDATDCDAAPSWYVDDPSNPTTALLCPATCAAYQADPGAVVEAWLGCPTELN